MQFRDGFLVQFAKLAGTILEFRKQISYPVGYGISHCPYCVANLYGGYHYRMECRPV